MTTWRSTSAASDHFLDRIDDATLDAVADPDDRIASVRDVMLQVIGEHARHCGHRPAPRVDRRSAGRVVPPP